jgi:hypothetical protein
MNMDTTIGDLLAQALTGQVSSPATPTQHPLPLGATVCVRTVTHTYVGLLSAIGDQFLTLDDAAWVADSRRWADFLADGPTDEAEIEPHPAGPTWVAVGAIVDVTPWRHGTLRVQR